MAIQGRSTMKRIYCFICTAAIIAVMLSGCQSNEAKLSERYVSSFYTEAFSLDAPVFTDIKEMEEASELIITGKRIGTPEKLQGNIMTNTVFTIQVEEVIKGPQELNTIKFFQLGEPSSDAYETKLKEDTTYLLFLTENYTRDTETGPEILYNSISFEQGIFEIDGSGLLKAYSRIGIAPQLEKKEFSLFKQELESAVQP